MSDFAVNPAGPLSGAMNGAGGIGGIGPVGPAHRLASASRLDGAEVKRTQRDAIGDRVEVSDKARFLSKLRELPEVRHDRIKLAKAAIAEGRYEKDEVLDRTIEALIEDLVVE